MIVGLGSSWLQPCYWGTLTRVGVRTAGGSLIPIRLVVQQPHLALLRTPGRLEDSGPSAFKSFTVYIRGGKGSNLRGDKTLDKPWFHCRWCTESWSRNHRINHAEIPEPVESSTGRNIKLMDRTPWLWVWFPVGEACHKHPGPDLVLTAEPIKTGSMMFNTV